MSLREWSALADPVPSSFSPYARDTGELEKPDDEYAVARIYSQTFDPTTAIAGDAENAVAPVVLSAP